MSDDSTLGTGPGEGQPASGTAPDGTGATTQTGPSPAGEGQPTGTQSQTTGGQTGSGDADGESFFDPRDLPPELMPAYKNMQKAFGKKMEAIKANRAKIDAYDSFSKDPVTQLQQMASQMGYRLTRADAQAAIDQGQQQGGDWEPQTWDEVMAKAEERVLQRLNPVFSELQNVKRQNVEKMLDDSCPDWRQYEDEMTSMLREHPSLAKDPALLYKLAVPPEVLETRATQAALKKLQAKTDSSRQSGISTTKPQGAQMPTGPISFNDAVAIAHARLAEQGIKKPH